MEKSYIRPELNESSSESVEREQEIQENIKQRRDHREHHRQRRALRQQRRATRHNARQQHKQCPQTLTLDDLNPYSLPEPRSPNLCSTSQCAIRFRRERHYVSARFHGLMAQFATISSHNLGLFYPRRTCSRFYGWRISRSTHPRQRGNSTIDLPRILGYAHSHN
jgi:hypothetical protein